MRLQKLTVMSVLVALSAVLTLLIKVPFPTAPFLIYEPGDVPILIGGLLFGPLAAMSMTVAISILLGFFVVNQNPVFGVIMHIMATGILSVVAASCYKGTIKSARRGLVLGAIAMTIVMPILNVWLNPIFYGMPREAVIKLLVPAIIPFNFLKSFINILFTALIFPRISTWYKRNIPETTKD